MSIDTIEPEKYDKCVTMMRTFFKVKGFIEVHTQTRVSILSACKDPTTISTYQYAGQVWPLPQTSQMCLEYEMLKYPKKAPGYFCLCTSYRNEPNQIEGRSENIFPIFEFELKGGLDELILLERDLIDFMGFRTKQKDSKYPEDTYKNIAEKYGVKELEHTHETRLEQDYGNVFFLKNFPNYTSPFWNIQQTDDGTAKKIDVIIHGVETISSAELSDNPTKMRIQFDSIMDGAYANILYRTFTKERVEYELQDFLSNTFIKRSCGSIGVNRMIRAMELSNLF